MASQLEMVKRLNSIPGDPGLRTKILAHQPERSVKSKVGYYLSINKLKWMCMILSFRKEIMPFFTLTRSDPYALTRLYGDSSSLLVTSRASKYTIS